MIMAVAPVVASKPHRPPTLELLKGDAPLPTLLSPIQLSAAAELPRTRVDARLLSPIHLLSPFKPTGKDRQCMPTTTKPARRRRPAAATIRAQPRRVANAHGISAQCPIIAHPTLHAWVPLPDAPIDEFSIADLSALPMEDNDVEPSGPGPVRRRKTSLRASPLSNTRDLPLLPIADGTAAFGRVVHEEFPRTPASHAPAPSLIRFHALMPVSSSPAEAGDMQWE